GGAIARADLLRHQRREREPLRRVPGRARQQPQRWDVLGLYPLFFAAHGLDVASIGVIKAVYPAVWGLLQIGTGLLSDRLGRKPLIAWGMIVQAAGIWVTVGVPTFGAWLAGAALQGIGTAMVYPTLLAAITD